jgi:hypothetical protein
MNEEVEVIEEEIEEVEEVEGEQEEVIPEEKVDNGIPQAIALGWKKDLKEAKRRLSEFEAKEEEHERASKVQKIRNLVIEKGMSEDEADLFASIQEELIKTIPRQDRVSAEIESDIEDLQDVYPNIKSIKSDLIKTVKKYRVADPDFSVEDAYKLVAPNRSARELKTELEQKVALSKTNIEPSPMGGSRAKKSKLTEDQRRTLKLMQTAHPDKNWTEDKFLKLNLTR